MQVSLRSARNGEEEIKAANYPEIRFFNVAAHPAYHHTNVPEGSWKVVSPETADQVSAVAYYFARKVQQTIHVPIGVIVDALGGTPAEAWTSAAALRSLKNFDVPLAEVEKERKPEMKDLAILCSNCHRAVHLIKPLPKTIAEFKKKYLNKRERC